tara:strand:+ start:139 stop:1665 length:1527 start_codon:yes stop_codon:yes gene_type:complete
MSLRPRETHSLPPLQRLAERCQPCTPTDKRYESLAYARFDNILQQGNWTTCAICLAELAGPAHALPGHSVATVVLKKTCGHIFHFECLRDWARAHLECPLCRTPMDAAERQELLPTLEELYAEVRRHLLQFIQDLNAGGYDEGWNRIEDAFDEDQGGAPSSAPLIQAIETAFATEKGLEVQAFGPPGDNDLYDPRREEKPTAGGLGVAEIVVWFGFADLVGEYVDPEAEGYHGIYNTPLMAASGRGHVAIVDLLLAAGADPSYQHMQHTRYAGWTALMWACVQGHADVVARLVAAGADVHAENKEYGNRDAITCAIEFNNVDAARALLDADVSAVEGALDRSGYEQGSALDFAEDHGDVEMVTLLETAMVAHFNWSPLMYACYKEDLDAVERALQVTTANINDMAEQRVMDGEAWTPLMMASYRDTPAIVARLLQVPGIDLNARSTNSDWTALEIAEQYGGGFEMATLLRAAMGLPAPEPPPSLGLDDEWHELLAQLEQTPQTWPPSQ